MVVLKIVATIEADKLTEFDQALGYILRTDKCGKDCLSRSVYRDWHVLNTILYLEEWKTIEGLQKHLRNDRFKSLLGAMKVLGQIHTAQIIDSVSVDFLEK